MQLLWYIRGSWVQASPVTTFVFYVTVFYFMNFGLEQQSLSHFVIFGFVCYSMNARDVTFFWMLTQMYTQGKVLLLKYKWLQGEENIRLRTISVIMSNLDADHTYCQLLLWALSNQRENVLRGIRMNQCVENWGQCNTHFDPMATELFRFKIGKWSVCIISLAFTKPKNISFPYFITSVNGWKQ